MSVVLIDYGSGNLHSAAKAFERAARGDTGSQRVVVSSDPDVVRKADRIVLPGVGAFADCKAGLVGMNGMEEALSEAVQQRGVPFMGICVGMQLLADQGLEHGGAAGFGWIGGKVVPIEPPNGRFKIPHMGWNVLQPTRPHPLFTGLKTGIAGEHAYFVHSYHFEATQAEDVLATTDYGQPLTAVVGRNNIVGVQFHPEKSQKLGLVLISNFLGWRP